VTPKPIFPDADYYDCSDPEELSHDTPEEAITYYLDGFATHKMTAEEALKEIRREVTVTCYRRRKVTEAEIEHWASNLLESLGESFSDEHGNPNDDHPCDPFPEGAEKIMHDAVKAILEKAKVWSCEDVGEVTLTPDQVEQMMREENPHWFVDEQP
jgi:hypothetical protein